MKVFITGAGGMIGSALTRRLLGRGDEVTGLFLPDEPDRDGLAELGLEIRRGDIRDAGCLEGLADGSDMVFHVAGRVEEWGTRRLFRESHLDGTRNVLRACAGKVGRFVYFSSAAYYGSGPWRGLTEDAPPVPSGLPYPDMKVACEELVRRYSRERGLEHTIIRPCNVIGPRSAHIRNVLDSFLKGPVPLVEGGSFSAAFVYLENLVDGVVAAADSGKAVNRAYHFVDDFQLTWRDYMTAVAALVGKRPLGSISYRQAYTFATVVEYLYLPLNRRPLANRFGMTLIGQDNHVDATRAREELSWSTRVAWEDVWAELAEWVSKEYPDQVVSR